MLSNIKVYIVNSLHFMKKIVRHDTTKIRNHEICLIFSSCFRLLRLPCGMRSLFLWGR
jgi:hypothetical protein